MKVSILLIKACGPFSLWNVLHFILCFNRYVNLFSFDFKQETNWQNEQICTKLDQLTYLKTLLLYKKEKQVNHFDIVNCRVLILFFNTDFFFFFTKLCSIQGIIRRNAALTDQMTSQEVYVSNLTEIKNIWKDTMDKKKSVPLRIEEFKEPFRNKLEEILNKSEALSKIAKEKLAEYEDISVSSKKSEETKRTAEILTDLLTKSMKIIQFSNMFLRSIFSAFATSNLIILANNNPFMNSFYFSV